jgi:hypothetical protein
LHIPHLLTLQQPVLFLLTQSLAEMGQLDLRKFLLCLAFASYLFQDSECESFAPLRSLSRQQIALPRRPCINIPRGGATATANANIKAKIEPIGKAFVDLTTAIWSLSRFLVAHQIEDQHSRIAEPIRQRINKILLQNNPTTGEEVVASSNNEVGTTSIAKPESVSVVLFPSRIFKLSLAAWILSEALDFLGILNDDTPRLLKHQMDRVWCDVQPKLVYGIARIKRWWSETLTLENLERIPSKYNFAVGTSLGMIVSPVLSIVVGSLWQPVVFIYILAEANASLKARSKFDLASLFVRTHHDIGTTLDHALERLRQMIRSAVPHPQSVDGALIQTSGGSRDMHSRRMQKDHPKTPRKSLLPWVRSKPSNKVVSYQETAKPEHPIVSMIRHGFMVGSAVGLFLRV